MANNDVSIVVSARDEASATIRAIRDQFEASTKDLKTMGVTMLATGAVITGALGLALKAAEEERVGIARLDNQLKNVGVSYNDVKGSLEAVITATQRKTGIADDQQREALGRLVMVTGDYNQALKLLPLALDLAAAKQIDVSTAGDLLGRVAMGNTSMLTRYGIVLKEGATAAEALAAIQEKVSGAAEATANQFDILKAEVGDLNESIGAALVPLLKTVVTNLIPIIENLRKWIEVHPGLVKAIAAVGIALVVGGGSLLFALKAISIALAVTQAMLGPAGWVALGVGVAAAAASILAINAMLDETATTTERATDTTKAGVYAWGDMRLAALKVQEALDPGLTGATKKVTQADAELTDAQKTLLDQVKQVADAYQYQTSAAGALGITVKDVQFAFLGMGGSEGALAAITQTLGDKVNNVQAWLDALGLTADAVDFKTRTLADSNQKVTSSYSEMTKSILDDAAALKKQEDAQASILRQAEEVLKAYQYETSEAGKLRLTVQDVEFAYLRLGGTQSGLISIMTQLGTEVGDVGAWLRATGLDAKEVDKIMAELKGTTDSLTASLKQQAAESQLAQDFAAINTIRSNQPPAAVFTKDNVPLLPKRLALPSGDTISWNGEQLVLNGTQGVGQTYIPTMDTGGLVTGPGVFAVGPGVKEIVRNPSPTNITIPIYLDSKLISEKVIRNIADLTGRQRV